MQLDTVTPTRYLVHANGVTAPPPFPRHWSSYPITVRRIGALHVATGYSEWCSDRRKYVLERHLIVARKLGCEVQYAEISCLPGCCS
jgi:hypothetical protein